MKNCTSGKWFLLLGGFCLLWSAGAGELRAGQNYPTHVSVFGKSSPETVAPQKISAAKEADIRKLMKELHSKDAEAQAMRDVAAAMRPVLLQLLPPGKYRKRLVELFFEKMHARATPEAVLNLEIPLYARYLSDAEIKGLIEFYKTPVGQTWVEVRPKLKAAVLGRTKAEGRKMWREIIREVLEEHPELGREFKSALRAARARER